MVWKLSVSASRNAPRTIRRAQQPCTGLLWSVENSLASIPACRALPTRVRRAQPLAGLGVNPNCLDFADPPATRRKMVPALLQIVRDRIRKRWLNQYDVRHPLLVKTRRVDRRLRS